MTDETRHRIALHALGRRPLAVAATAALTVLATLAPGADVSRAEEPDRGPAPELEVTLRLDRRAYLPGEPVVAYVAVTNRGGAKARVDSRLDAELGVIRYLITGPDGVERWLRPYVVADAAFPPVDLEPGASVRGTARLDFGGDGWTFRELGSYAVRASYRGRRFRSEPVAVEIERPRAGPEAEHSATLLDSLDLGAFWLFEEGDHFPGALAALGRIDGEREGSVLGRYAAYMLGSAFSKSFADFEARRLRPADRPRAIAHLGAVKDALPSFYFTAKAHLLLALDYRRLGRADRAERVHADLDRLLDGRYEGLAPWLAVIRAEVARSFERRADRPAGS